jgi:hypothetical protein
MLLQNILSVLQSNGNIMYELRILCRSGLIENRTVKCEAISDHAFKFLHKKILRPKILFHLRVLWSGDNLTESIQRTHIRTPCLERRTR